MKQFVEVLRGDGRHPVVDEQILLMRRHQFSTRTLWFGLRVHFRFGFEQRRKQQFGIGEVGVSAVLPVPSM